MKQVIYYTDKITGKTLVLAEVTSNHSMTVWEALEVAGVDMDEYASANGWDGWDPEAIEFAEEEEMKEFAIVTEKGIDIWVDRFETEEEAMRTAKWEWNNRLTAADKNGRAITVGRLANPEDGDSCEMSEVFIAFNDIVLTATKLSN